MSGGSEVVRNLSGQDPGRRKRHSNTAVTLSTKNGPANTLSHAPSRPDRSAGKCAGRLDLGGGLMTMDRKQTRPRGFAPWVSRVEARALVRDVHNVLDAYRVHLPPHPCSNYPFASLAEDLSTMTLDICRAEPRFTGLTVTCEQVVDLDLRTAPANAIDWRQFADNTVRTEVIDSDTLTHILCEAIEARLAANVANDLLEHKAEMHAALVSMLEGAQ